MDKILQESYLENNIEQTIEIDKIENLEEKQNNFLQGNLGKVINTGVDIGLRMILPNVIEDKVIDIKNAIINNGFKEGISSAINSSIDLREKCSWYFYRKI